MGSLEHNKEGGLKSWGLQGEPVKSDKETKRGSLGVVFQILGCSQEDRLRRVLLVRFALTVFQIFWGIRKNVNPNIDVGGLIRVSWNAIGNTANVRGNLKIERTLRWPPYTKSRPFHLAESLESKGVTQDP